MLQDVLAYIIVGLAVAYVLYSLIKVITQKNDSGCAGACSCDAKKQFSKRR